MKRIFLALYVTSRLLLFPYRPSSAADENAALEQRISRLCDNPKTSALNGNGVLSDSPTGDEEEVHALWAEGKELPYPAIASAEKVIENPDERPERIRGAIGIVSLLLRIHPEWSGAVTDARRTICGRIEASTGKEDLWTVTLCLSFLNELGTTADLKERRLKGYQENKREFGLRLEGVLRYEGWLPRQVRIEYEGATYHVMCRGDRGEDLQTNLGVRICDLGFYAWRSQTAWFS